MGPLTRARNLREMFGHDGDFRFIRRFGVKRFLRSYLLASRMMPFLVKIFLRRVVAVTKTLEATAA